MDAHSKEKESGCSRTNKQMHINSEENASKRSPLQPGRDIRQNSGEPRTSGARSDVLEHPGYFDEAHQRQMQQQKNKPNSRVHPGSSTPHRQYDNTNSLAALQETEPERPPLSASYVGTQQNIAMEASAVPRPRSMIIDPRFFPSNSWERLPSEQTQGLVPLMAVKTPNFDRSREETGARTKTNWHQPVKSNRSLDNLRGQDSTHSSLETYNLVDVKAKSRTSNRFRKNKQKKIIVSPDETPGNDLRPLNPSRNRVRRDSSSSFASDSSTSSATSLQDQGCFTTGRADEQGQKQKLKSSRNRRQRTQGRKNHGHEGLLQDDNIYPGTHIKPAQLSNSGNLNKTDKATNCTSGGDQLKKVIVFSPPSISSLTSSTAASLEKKEKKNQRSSRRNSRSASCTSESGDIKKERGAGLTDQREDSKACKVEICFPRATDLDTIRRYLAQDYIMPRTRYNYEIEAVQLNAPGTSRYIAVFSSVNQGKKAVKLLQKFNKGREAESGGAEMSVRLINKEVSTDNEMINKCAREIKEKADGVIAAHDEKVKEVEREMERLPKGRKGKGMSLELFYEIEPKIKALKSKKDELQMQKMEFVKFMESFQEKLQALEETGPELSQKLTQLRTCFGRERRQLETALPIYARKSEIIQTVQDSQVCVILAETGSGKSTQITQYLYEAGYADGGFIVCTQPRKVAATSLANYVSSQMGSPPGQLVSSIVGARGKRSAKTAILYMTDHALLNECLRDPTLSKYSCVIVDEAHERSIFTDLLLGMIKRTLSQRKDLRVVITSATIDPGLFMRYFSGCRKLEISGRMFPVEILWKETSCGDGNHVKEAVSKACEVHETEGNGDVLVFLTSPAEIQKACEMMPSRVEITKVECLPLHGKLRPEDQKKVFQPLLGKRKVIFATNCAETSITIPGIKFVIDSGMVKEMRYDARRNMNSLEVRPINKSSAEQRKGRAGRTEAGKCFRLYSKEEYQAMDDGSTPEILRIHLGQAILKLMELGIGDPTMFHFVERPPDDSLQSAWQSLISLGAVQEDRLTELGRQMARLPMEPRLAKLLVEGINEGVGNEALILTSVATVNGSIFFRMGTDEEKKQHDMRKIQFCHPGGDLLTLLSVYRDWSALREKDKHVRNKWCYDNSLNAKAMRMADETIKELRMILKQELSIDNLHRSSPSSTQASSAGSQQLSCESDDVNAKLQKIILACYALNLCIFTGNERAGYKVASLNNCVQLHPSSSLKYLDHSPEFVVYEQLMKTNKDYILNVTPVERDWVEEHVARGLVPNLTSKDLEKLNSEVLVANSMLCSKEIMQMAVGIGFKGKTLRSELEDEVSQRCSGALAVIEPDCDKGFVKIYVPLQYKASAAGVVEAQLEKERQRHRLKSTEVPVDAKSNDVRVVIGRGGVVQHVLMSNMYRSVVVQNVPDDFLLEDVLTWLGDRGGEIVQHNSWVSNTNGKMGVSVLFQDPEQALKVVQLARVESCGFTVKPDYKGTSPESNRTVHPGNFTVKVSWPRRKSKGMASIKFYNSEDFISASHKLSGNSFVINSTLAFFSIDKHRDEQIFVKNLHPSVCETDLKAFAEKELSGTDERTRMFGEYGVNGDEGDDDEIDEEEDDDGDDEDSSNVGYASGGRVSGRHVNVLDDVRHRQKIEVKEIFIIREKSFESSEEECKRLKTQLQNKIEKIVPNARFEVKLSKPRPATVSWWAFVDFSEPNDGHAVIRELNGKSVNYFCDRLVYKLTPQLRCRLMCLKKTYLAVKKTLHGLENTIAEDCLKRCGRMVKSEHTDATGNRVQLQLNGECLEHYVYMRNAVGQVLSGDKLDCKACEGMEVLLTKHGRDFLQRVEKTTNAAILPDWRTSTISIFGSDEVKTRAKTAINDFLNDILAGGNDLWEVNLRAQDKPPGLIKAIIKRFGPDLKQLESMEGVVRASLDLRKHLLNIQSTPDARTVVEDEIKVCIATLPPPGQVEPDTPVEECPVCLVEPDVNQYRLVCCGHAYCKDCINGQLQARELPLKCAKEGCNEEFVLRDLELLLKQHEQRRLTSEAVKKYVGSHPDEVRYCTTPNCHMVYRVTQDGRRFACNVCSAEICTACHMEYHGGISCAMYKSEKRDGGEENLKRWMKEDTQNRKQCPRCKAIIEKNGGCNHMTCGQCREHICWLCLKICGSEDGFYRHQSHCPARH